MEALFSDHLPRFLADLKRQDPGATLKLVFFAHGGLNDEVESLRNARNRIPFYLANQCYPLFFIWETGQKETFPPSSSRSSGWAGRGRGIRRRRHQPQRSGAEGAVPQCRLLDVT